MLDTIAVSLALSGSDAHLLQYARSIADAGIGTRFQFVHVVVPGRGVDPSSVDVEPVHEIMRGFVEEHFSGGRPGLSMEFHVRVGVRVDQLLHFLEGCGCGVVMMGHRENRSGKRSLARRLAMISPASVWMVPENAPIDVQRVLAPIDFSPHSADSLHIATGISSRMQLSECLALHVFFDASTVRYDEHEDEVRGDEARGFAEFVRPINTHEVPVRALFEESANVSEAILSIVARERCDLIVMSTRGRSAAAAILIGSETSQTIMRSPVPVLAVKHRGARLNLFQALTDKDFWTRPTPKTG